VAKVTAKDLYMNFVALEGAIDETDATELMEAVINTGLTIRGALIWLIHLVELYIPMPRVTTARITVALSTRQGLAAMPAIGDDGVIVRASHDFHITTSGMQRFLMPLALHYLPPIPIATPQLSLYIQEDTADADLLGAAVAGRLGFTTTALDAAVYTEIAEAWGW